jgi:hypothetical protein
MTNSVDLSRIQNDFYLFFRNINPDFIVYSYQRYLLETIQRELVDNTANNKRLMLSMPPGYGKSFLTTQLLPAFLLGRDPSLKICICSYSYSIANNLGKLCKAIMMSPEYKTIFPQTKIITQGESGNFNLSGGGEVYCVGRGGSITSRRFDIIIGDDLIKDSNEAQSTKIMSKLGPWFFSTLLTRLYRTKPTMLCLIATRWHQSDPTGLCIESFPEWPYISLDAIAEESDLLGRQPGEVLCPEMQTKDELEAIKAADPKSFSALYQNNPVSQESTFFSLKNIELAKRLPDSLPAEKPIVTISYDTATETGPRADYTVAIVAKYYESQNILVVDNVVRTKVDFTGLLALFDQLQDIYQPDYQVVEKASSGQQLLQMRPQAIPSQVFKNATEKENYSVTLNHSLGQTVFFNPSCLTWELEDELASFPFGKHDDFIMALLHLYKFLTETKLQKNSRVGNTNKAIRLLRISKVYFKENFSSNK